MALFLNLVFWGAVVIILLSWPIMRYGVRRPANGELGKLSEIEKAIKKYHK